MVFGYVLVISPDDEEDDGSGDTTNHQRPKNKLIIILDLVDIFLLMGFEFDEIADAVVETGKREGECSAAGVQ